MIRDIAFTAYPARDVRALCAWYARSLGLAFKGAYEENGVAMYDEADVGTGCFAIMTAAWLGRDPGSAAGIVFEVDDLDAAIADLRAKGIAVEEPYATPVCRMTSLLDAEGNKVNLHQVAVAR